jgi:hypothetical protein
MHCSSLNSNRPQVILILIAWALFSPCANLFAAMLQWDANPEPNIAGYRVHMGPQAGQYESVIDVGLATEMLVPPLEPDRPCFFSVTAYDSEGMESGFSDEINCTLSASITNGTTVTNAVLLVPLSLKFSGRTLPMHISFVGEASKEYQVQATTDFQSWQVIHTITLPANGLYQWWDADAPNHSKRFYRIVCSHQ